MKMKKVIVFFIVIFLVIGCKEENVTEDTVETPIKMVCSMSALGENKVIFEYLHEKLISYQFNYAVKVNSERDIQDWTKEWKYSLDILKGIKGINVIWGINNDRTEMSSEITASIQEINIEDIPAEDDGELYDLVYKKDVFNWEEIKEKYESWGFSCQ